MAIKNYKLITLFGFLFSVHVLAETPQKNFGHNLSPSTETLSQGQWTAGSIYLGTGLTDQFTVGISPWMLVGYNLENIILKYRHPFFADDQEVSHQFAYFNSNTQLGSFYKQKSISYWLTYRKNFSGYNFLTTFNYMYFYSERAPFSLRREPFNRQAQQLTLTTLHQFYFSESTILQFELGVLGVNYSYPSLEVGASWLHYFNTKWSLQIGASASKRFAEPQYFDPKDAYIESPENYEAMSLHPEIQLQYWF